MQHASRLPTVPLLHTVLGDVQAQGLGFGFGLGLGVQDGLGFSEQVAAPTLLSCLVFSSRQRA